MLRIRWCVGRAAGCFVLLAALPLVLGGCPNVIPDSGSEPGVTEVIMQDSAFVPATVTIRAGESVRWTNQDTVPHTATSGQPGAPDAGRLFDTGTLGIGQSATIPFNAPGEYVYFCRFHPTTMVGAKVVVTQ